MFGTNPVRNYESHANGRKLQVREIFYTLQGEGPYSGRAAVFVRLTGCNLRCWFCDTKWDDEGDPLWSVEDIVKEVEVQANGRTDLVVLTGGEPLRQDVGLLLTLLWEKKFHVQIETAGTLWQPILERAVIGSGINRPLPGTLTVVVSPKTQRIHPDIHRVAAAFKYVVSAEDTFGDLTGVPYNATQVKGKFRGVPLAEPRKGALVFLSPCDEYDEDKNRANRSKVAELALKHGYIAGLQLHKHLDLP